MHRQMQHSTHHQHHECPAPPRCEETIRKRHHRTHHMVHMWGQNAGHFVHRPALLVSIDGWLLIDGSSALNEIKMSALRTTRSFAQVAAQCAHQILWRIDRGRPGQSRPSCSTSHRRERA